MWIKRRDNNVKSGLPIFRKKFTASGSLTRCELKITATGIFNVQINGHEIPDLFMPGWTNYLKRIDLCRYDVTEFIKSENEISVTVANGWYSGKLGYGNKTNVFGDEKRLYAEITLYYSDGETETVTTDESWETLDSDVLFADFFDGEVSDARRRGKVINEAPAKIAEFSVPFTDYAREPVRITESLSAKIIYEDDTTVRYDFGRNFAGVLKITAKGNAGDKIIVKYGEMLDGGEVYVANLRRAKCTDEFILSGGLDVFEPKFTYHGFRYAEIKKDSGVRILETLGKVISQNVEYYGGFECSDGVINGIYEMALNGQKSNFIAIPTDCPQRDERLGWAGDAEVFCNSAMFNANCDLFFKNYLGLVRDDMLKDGRVPSIVPLYMPVADNTAGVPGWGDVICVMPYFHYLHYRDASVIKDNLSAAEAWVGYYIKKSKNYLTKITNNFGDWLSIDGETDADVINQCFFGYSTLLTAKMCEILGDIDKKARYTGVYENCKQAFRDNYLTFGRIKSDTQTAYAFAYAAGFITREETAARLPAAVHKKGDSLTTGFIGSRFILPVLCDIGEAELAYKLIRRTEYPSLGYMLKEGATTVWERWNGYTEKDGFEDPEMNSFNHYSLGSCTEWLYSYVLGIKLSPYTETVVISPSFNRDLSYARGETKLKGGKISVFWQYENAAVKLIVKAADGVQYEIDKSCGELISLTKTGNETVAVFKA